MPTTIILSGQQELYSPWVSMAKRPECNITPAKDNNYL